MIIRLDDELNIIEFMAIGGDPEEPDCYELEEIDPEILSDIFSYKYINNTFVLKSNTSLEHLNAAKTQKLHFLSSTCKDVIEKGIQVGDYHYSLTYADQINLSKLASQAVMTPQLPIFYHADGELCREYSIEEILNIAQLSVNWVTYHTTYHNFAKAYVLSMTDFDTVASFSFGMPLSEEYEERMEAITETTHVVYTDIINDPYDYDNILHPVKDFVDMPSGTFSNVGLEEDLNIGLGGEEE